MSQPRDKKELSGTFSSAEKWSTVLCSLRSSDCPVQHLHVMHTQAQHNILAAAALYFNTSITQLEWSDLDPTGAHCLSAVLAASSSIRVLKVQRCQGAVEPVLAELLPGLRRSRSLEELHLAWAGPECLLAAAAAVRGPQSVLARLLISRSSLQQPVADCFARAYALGDGALQELSLSECTMDSRALHTLLTALEAQQHVVKLGMSSCGLTDDHVAGLLDSPLLCERLQHLSLANNPSMGCGGVNLLMQAFVGAGCCLSSLDLRQTGLDDRCGNDLAALVRHCRALQALQLGENELGDAAVGALAAVVGAHPRMLELDLSGSKFTGIKELGLLVGPASPLLKLHLCKNWRIGDEGATAVAEQLRHNTRLKELHLSEAGIKCEGAKALAAAVQLHPALVALHLDGCRIGDKGACALMDAVRANLNMRCWSIDNNRVRDKMTKKMVEDFAAAVCRRTDESVQQRKSWQKQHAAHSPCASTPTSPTVTTPRASPSASPRQHTPCPLSLAMGTNPAVHQANTASSPGRRERDVHVREGDPRWQPSPRSVRQRHDSREDVVMSDDCPTPPGMQTAPLVFTSRQGDEGAFPRSFPSITLADGTFPRILALWNNMGRGKGSLSSSLDKGTDSEAGSMTSPDVSPGDKGDMIPAGNVREGDREPGSPRSLFESFRPALRNLDSFGRWLSGTKPLNSVESLHAWGSFLPGMRPGSRGGSVSVVQPMDVDGGESQGNLSPRGGPFSPSSTLSQVSFGTGNTQDLEESESPRHIGRLNNLTRSITSGSFRFMDYLRSSSESAGTPSCRPASPAPALREVSATTKALREARDRSHASRLSNVHEYHESELEFDSDIEQEQEPQPQPCEQCQ